MATLGFSGIKIGIFEKEESGKDDKIIKIISIGKKAAGQLRLKLQA